MNFNFYLLKSIRIVLFPFSLLYGLAVITRNFLFDKGVFKSASFNMPVICIGNLSAGGTGKSPMTEYLLRLLKDRFKTATISRGYKRKTKGYALANEQTTALDIGDEPKQFHIKFPEVSVAVGEERIVAIPQLLHDRPDTQVILLDDAFQHRTIRAGLNILLTECSNLFTRDFFLPTGDLRDQRSSYKRADVIVITKCPLGLTLQEKENIISEIKPLQHQKVFFTATEYGTPYHIFSGEQRPIIADDEVLLICGIANPAPLKSYISDKAKTYYERLYSNHHIFTIDDVKEIRKKYEQVEDERKIILTTEKDAVRLLKFQQELAPLPLYALPVKHRFLFDEGTNFDRMVLDFVSNFKK